MSTRVIDLTGSDSDAEGSPPANRKIAAMPRPRAARQPLSDVRNGSRVNGTPAGDISPILLKAINTMNADRLRIYLRQFCRDIPEVRDQLAAQTLSKGKDVVRYHKDSDSEDDVNSEIWSSEGGEEDEDEDDVSKTEKVKPLKPIAAGDDEIVPMYAKCENCEQEFDVSTNDTRECQWHTGEKELNEDDDFWADHDDRCHGDPYSFIDHSDYAEGFKWTCCDNPGDHEGCKTTKHKAPVNVIQVTDIAQTAQSNKRRADEEMQRPVFARCVNCDKRYDNNEDTAEACASHSGQKVIDDENEYWADWDDQCHGDPESLIDDPEHTAGFMWDCCDGALMSVGCVKARHEPLPHEFRK